MELAEDEMKNWGKLWAMVLGSLCYCFILSRATRTGFLRLVMILPVVLLFFLLPLNLTSVHLAGTTSFFITWLANFKLLLLAFGRGPLCSDPSISLPKFIAIACLPIKVQQNPAPPTSTNSRNKENQSQITQNKTNPPPNSSSKSPNHQNLSNKGQTKAEPSPQIPSKKPRKSPLVYLIKIVIMLLILKTYDHIPKLNSTVVWFIYLLHIYISLELILAMVATTAKCLLGLELEPQFHEPLLATSLQDFWGRRWNLMVSSILRPSVYDPVLNLSSRLMSRKTATLPAVMATFAVSAVMHEVMYFYIGRVRPTFEVSAFFLLHGACLCMEISLKKSLGNMWRVPRGVSGPATMAFVVATGFWLFLPPMLRFGADVRAREEYAVVGEFVRSNLGIFPRLTSFLPSSWLHVI